jgi:cytochrome o ubiquinol oxidase subunit II
MIAAPALSAKNALAARVAETIMTRLYPASNLIKIGATDRGSGMLVPFVSDACRLCWRRSAWRAMAALGLCAFVSGCNAVVLDPSGDVAVQQRDLIVHSTVLMLLICVPVIALTLLFAWHYRESNRRAHYDPGWDHSLQVEVVVWAAPLAIIIALGAITWLSTHTLDPYRGLMRIDAQRPLPADAKPLTVEVVALDWKWLFFYPDQGIAVLNELAAPVDMPIAFKITSASVMNSFFIPALAGQIYAMPGMQTQLHAVINKAGVYDGFSGNYSGSGFTRMTFKFFGVTQPDFDQWVARAKTEGTALDRNAYLLLEKPSTQEPVRRFSTVEEGLYNAILNLCVPPGKMCMSEMRHIDAKGGAGTHSHDNSKRLEYESLRSQPGHQAAGAAVSDAHHGEVAPGRKIQVAPAQLNIRSGP